MFGIQTFLKGTSFDAFNSIDFSYVIDIIYPLGNTSGTRTYSIPQGFKLTASCSYLVLGEVYTSIATPLVVTGNTITWNTPVNSRILVTMEST